MKQKTGSKVKKWWIWWIIKAFSIKSLNAFVVDYSLIWSVSFPSDCIRFKLLNRFKELMKTAFQIHHIHHYWSFCYGN